MILKKIKNSCTLKPKTMILLRILAYPFVLIKLIAIALLASIFAAYDELFVLPKYLKNK